MSAPVLEAGVTRLMDANGGPITLSAKDALAGSQPLWVADGGDGMPALGFSAVDGSQHLKTSVTLSLETETLFLLMKCTEPNGGWGGVLGMGLAGQPSFQLDNGGGTIFKPRLAGGTPVPSLVPGAVDYLGQWVTLVVELDAPGGQARLWNNGTMLASAAYAPGGPFSASQFVLGATRALLNSTVMTFAHGFVLHEAGASTRTKGIDYLRRIWGARVQGWA